MKMSCYLLQVQTDEKICKNKEYEETITTAYYNFFFFPSPICHPLFTTTPLFKQMYFINLFFFLFIICILFYICIFNSYTMITNLLHLAHLHVRT
ncbi:hypothetical protein PUN28_018662 [Cardiocondyla obscurior]|uniref:Uncharacterized protein n=1 Tax=Cardiocondyla obscurior TaxID=286306 RepID=A0AAW2EKV4_9HYME